MEQIDLQQRGSPSSGPVCPGPTEPRGRHSGTRKIASAGGGGAGGGGNGGVGGQGSGGGGAGGTGSGNGAGEDLGSGGGGSVGVGSGGASVGSAGGSARVDAGNTRMARVDRPRKKKGFVAGPERVPQVGRDNLVVKDLWYLVYPMLFNSSM